MDEDGFILVKYSKHRRRQFNKFACKTNPAITQELPGHPGDAPTKCSKKKLLRKIAYAVSALEESEYYRNLLNSLKNLLRLELKRTAEDIVQVVCYGLGSFTIGAKSIEQFALLVNLQKELQIPLEFYDPVFNEIDRAIIAEDYQFVVLQNNEEGLRRVEDLTLFYLPHCPHKLSNNLLYANWSPVRLKNCIIIGNGFSKILGTIPHPQLPPFNYMLKAKPLLKEVHISNSYKPFDVFNDLAIHVFPTNSCDDNTTWEQDSGV